jgi:hypothetical protein
MFLVKAFCILCALNERIQQVGLATEVEITEAGYSTNVKNVSCRRSIHRVLQNMNEPSSTKLN